MTFHSSDDGFWGECRNNGSYFLMAMKQQVKQYIEICLLHTYKDFIATNGEDWAWKDWNDDLAWAVLGIQLEHILLLGDQNNT